MKFRPFLATAVLVLAAAARAEDFFAARVEPLLRQHCYECHSHAAGVMEAGLALDSRSGWQQGGVSGPAIVPEKPDESLLVRMIRWQDEDHRMPPAGKLAPSQIAVIEDWVRHGAADPRITVTPPAEAESWWSLEPLPTADSHRASTALLSGASGDGERRGAEASAVIDALVAKGLAGRGLVPTSEADRAVLVRRLTFDLHGLPPTPQEIEDFVSDPDPLAYEHLVERLLASPRYGERFGRLWLDVVHYGESNGFGMDRPRMHAWRYRDYVIAAFNEDKPYARFVQEQLAADAIFPDEPGLIPALGFIAAGPFNQSALVEQTDGTECKKIALNLDRDDMVANVSTSFLSVTLHCARCHQHKFDPISQRDYYAMQAVFAGVARGDREFDADAGLMREREHWQAVRRRMAAGEPFDRFDEPDRRRIAATAPRLLDRLALQETAWQVLAPGVASETSGVIATQLEDGSFRLAGGLPDRDVITITAPVHARTAAALRIEVLADRALPQGGPGRAPDNGNFVLSELKITAAPADAPHEGVPVKIRQGRADWEQDGHAVAAAYDGNDATGWAIAPRQGESHQAVFIFDKPFVRECGAVLTVRLEQKHGAGHLIGRLRVSVTAEDVTGQLLASPDVIARARRPGAAEDPAVPAALGTLLVDEISAALPPRHKVWAVGARLPRFRNYAPPQEPYPIAILARGDVNRPGREVPPGGLACVKTLPSEFGLVDPKDEASRRVALARWVTNPENMLTWRSIANRIWHWHFARGIVETMNDFGHMGSRPSNPELLDWLACEFRDSGGSFKHLHRVILHSATWRQRSAIQSDAAAAVAVDADNRLLWRQNRRRLDAEQLRDALLAASGRLDVTAGGPSAMQFNFSDPNRDVVPRIDYQGFDPDAPASLRRGVYRFLFRNVNDPLLEAFDAVDPSLSTPVRDETVTPLQALSLANNTFVLRQCTHLAGRLEREAATPEARIERACMLLFGRLPDEDLRRDLADHASRHGLPHACRVLVNSNAFLYVE